jgi:Aldo/keto reductase family
MASADRGDGKEKDREGSLPRLSRDHVDIFHLHNAITDAGGGDTLSVRQVLEDVVPAFERLRQQGKTRFLGLTAIGDTTALQRVIEARAFDSAQVVYNMLNPSAAIELPPNYPAQDYGRLFDHTMAPSVILSPPSGVLWASANRRSPSKQKNAKSSSNSGWRANSLQNQRAGTRTKFSSGATRLRSPSRTDAGAARLPAGPRPAIGPVQHYFGTEE